MHWPSVLAAYGCLFVMGLLDNSRGPLFPDVLGALTLDDTQGAWLFAAASAAGGVGSLCGRRLLRSLRPARALHLGLLVCALGVHLLGTSGSFRQLVVGSIVFGFSLGAVSLVQGTLVQRGVPLALQRRAFGGLHAMYGAASLLAPFAVLALTGAGADWAGTFRLLALPPLALLALTLALHDPPAAAQEAPAAAARVVAAPAGGGLLVAVMAGLCVAAELAISSRLVLHLRRLGWGQEEAAHALAAFFACLLAARVLLGLVPLPWSNRAVLAGSAGLSLALTVLGLVEHPAFLCAAGLTLGPFFPTLSALVADEFEGAFERVMGTVLAAVCVVVMATHWLVGALSDAFQLHRALWLAPGLLLVTLGLVPLSARRVRP